MQLSGPKEAKLNEPVLFYGKVTVNSIIDIYSSDIKETTTYPYKGLFYVNLFFTNVGTYEIHATLAGIHESNEIWIDIS